MDKEKTIRKIVNDFFKKMDIEGVPEKIDIQDNLISFEIETDSPQILIGKRGQILSDIQHLISRLINKKLEEKFFVDFDINHYKKNKINYLKEMAEDISNEVLLTKKTKVLMPMSSFERRIIHLAVAERDGLTTESEGEGLDRRVVIKIDH